MARRQFKKVLGSFDGLIHFSMVFQPGHISAFSMFPNIPEKVDGFWLETWFGGIIRWKDHFHLDSQHKSVGLHQSGPFNPFARNTHASIPFEEMNGYQLGHPAMAQVGPNSLHFATIRQNNSYFDSRMRNGMGPFRNQ
jgi:hypothetical protein